MHENLAKQYVMGKASVQSEAFASKVLEAALSGLYVYDFDQGRDVFINARYTQLTGYTLEDLEALDRKQYLALFHPDDQPRMAAHMQLIKNGCEDVGPIEYRFKTKGGRWIWCLSFNSAFAYAEGGAVIQFIGSFIDVTDRKQTEQALIGSERINRELEQRVAERTAEIENQYKTLEKFNGIIKQLSRKTIAAIENDRKALSKEIHDSIGGSLSAIKMMLESNFKGSGTREIIEHLAYTIKETKRISFLMHSLALDELGLRAAISENIKIFKSFYPDAKVEFQALLSLGKLSEEITIVIYRVIQEGLNTIGKQGRANQIKILLTELEDRIHIEIEDNGCSLEIKGTPCPQDAAQDLGIQSVKERVEICDGTFHIESIPGKGTRLIASIPKEL